MEEIPAGMLSCGPVVGVLALECDSDVDAGATTVVAAAAGAMALAPAVFAVLVKEWNGFTYVNFAFELD